MGFGQLEDLEGSFELVIFSEPFEQHVELLRMAKDGGGAEGEVGPIPLVIHGTLAIWGSASRCMSGVRMARGVEASCLLPAVRAAPIQALSSLPLAGGCAAAR